MCTHWKQFITSSNDMMLIKLFAFFLLFKNSDACARSSLDNISTKSNTSYHRTLDNSDPHEPWIRTATR
jgi:hypothetical protein